MCSAPTSDRRRTDIQQVEDEMVGDEKLAAQAKANPIGNYKHVLEEGQGARAVAEFVEVLQPTD